MTFWKQKARELKKQTYTLYFAYQNPEIPWYAKVWIALLVAYAFSPIDLIPDFIPVLGYLDDLIIIPLGVLLAVKMIPQQVMEESRAKAEEQMSGGKPQFRFMRYIVIGVWILVILIIGVFVGRIFLARK